MASTRNANRRRRMLLLAPTSSEGAAPPSDEIPADVPENKAVQKFREACQAAAPIRLRVTGEGLDDPLEFSFSAPFVVIGRGRRADLRLNHPDVSLRHTYLQTVGGHMYCVDLESRTGISRDSGRRSGDKIDEGESIRIGPFQVHVIDWRSSDEIETFDDEEDQSNDEEISDLAVRVNVEVLNGKKGGRRFRPVEEVITLVGNAPGSHLRLKDASMSKSHCALVRTAEALWCVDLLGRGGTRLNGAEIRIGRLYDGDLLHVGKAKLKIHYSTMDNEPSRVSPEPPRAAVEESTENEPVTEQTPASSNTHNTPVAELAGALNQLIAQNLAAVTPAGGTSLAPFVPNIPATGPLPQLPAARNDAERNVSEAFVMSLVNHFGQMQQQMFQQSQQSMMMLLNMFSNLHQNHMELIRDDLNRIHQITDELRAVQLQMAAADRTDATNVAYTRDAEHERDPHESVQDAVISPAAFAEPPPSEAPQRTTPPPAPSESPDAPADGPPPTADTGDRRRDRSGVRTHTLLSERLAELESERNSRWQKIMKTITGMGGA